jgi:hypothetical protein
MKDLDEVRSWCQELTSNNHFFGFITSCYASHAAVGKQGASLHIHVDVVSLFHQDDAKSVCLLRGAPLGDFEDLNDHFIIETNGLDLAGNDTGMIARGLIGEDSTVVSVDFATYWLRQNQPQWLGNSCQAYKERCAYGPNASDLAALSKISHFEFGLEQVCIRLSKVPNRVTSSPWTARMN